MGRQLCELRKQLGLSREQLASEWGIGPKRVGEMESGKETVLSLHLGYLRQRAELSDRHKPTHAGTVAFYIFLDLLGFSHMVEREWSQDLLEHLKRAYGRAIESLRSWSDSSLSDHRFFEVRNLSDSVLVACPIGDFEKDTHWIGQLGESKFIGLLNAVFNFQLTLVLEGFFIRGGWTIHYLYSDKDHLIGPAMPEAYKLEKDRAIYPRVVLGETMATLILKQASFYAKGEDPQSTAFLCDEDGCLFANYLRALVDDEHKPWELDTDRLMRHKEVIEQKLAQHAGNDSVTEKYRWSAAYHNWFVGWAVSALSLESTDEFFVEVPERNFSPARIENNSFDADEEYMDNATFAAILKNHLERHTPQTILGTGELCVCRCSHLSLRFSAPTGRHIPAQSNALGTGQSHPIAP